MHQARILAKSGHSQKEIAELIGVSDRMVRNYLRSDYQTKSRAPRPSLLDPFKPDIDMILEEKPFFNLTVLAEKLRARGYQGGLSILRDYAARIRQQVLTKAVLRFETEPGRQAQVDWKECGRWIVNGQILKVYAFVMLLGYSRKPFVLFTSSMTSPVLLAAHSEAFTFFGGVPEEVLYDNMKTAWIAQGSEWVVNKDLLNYAAQVGFEPKRCQVRRPQTKGKVERFIGYLGNHFLPMVREQELQTIEELNHAIGPWLAKVDQEELREFCQTRSDRFDHEKSHLQPWNPKAVPPAWMQHNLLVSREGLVSFETNRYSIPAQYLGRSITLRIHPLTREAEFVFDMEVLYRRILEPAGCHRRFIRPEDAQSLKKRWEEENRPAKVLRLTKVPPSDPPENERAHIEVEVRSPGTYDQIVEASA
jgi:transposase